MFSLLLNVELAKAEDMILTGSGIHYPRGFDTNTVDSIRGKAFGIYYPEKGPVQFQLQSQSETFTVLSSPKWYWKDLGEKISDGIEVEVHGSKSLGKDGKLYIIAQEIRIFSSGESLFFRTEDGIPLWSGTLRRKRSLQRQHGSSHRGTGGMKGGTGNMKRGHY